MKSALLLLAAVMMFVSHPVAAQSKAAQAKSIAGTWKATVTLPNGGGGAPTLTFAVKGDSVSGTVKRPSGEEFPLRGTIKGKDLTYSYSIPGDSQQILVTVKATVMGDSLSGTMDFGGRATGQLTAKRAK
jgi:hypothetical protein